LVSAPGGGRVIADVPRGNFRAYPTPRVPRMRLAPRFLAFLLPFAGPAFAQPARPLLPIPFENSFEFAALAKKVHASRVLDDLTDPATWRTSGTASVTFPSAPRLNGMRVMRVEMQLFHDAPAPTRTRLSSVTLQRPVAGEDWSGYNRLSLWIRTEVAGVPALPLAISLRNDGVEQVPDRYRREGTHYVTLARSGWQQVTWEIDPLARDRVTLLEIGYWVNKMFAAPGDRIVFEIGRIELQRVDPAHHTGWNVAPGTVAFSHSGYQTGASKSALASDVTAESFQLIRLGGPLAVGADGQEVAPGSGALGQVVLDRDVQAVATRLGRFQRMEFSDVQLPGTYVIRAGDRTTRPFQIGDDVWTESIWKVLNFFYGNRCGFDVPGVHPVDHLDWFATHGADSIVMSGGWHDAGDLSQGVINTGEATYAMFALAERVRGADDELHERLLEEARWGLEWVMRVRFPGGYRISFASHNLWTNNRVGDADDRSREALNNPNANYIAAAAEAIASRVLREADPRLARRALAIAEEDWGHAITGVEGPATRHTPAFAATRMELASIGVTASVELYRATRRRQYADKAVELARLLVASQQVAAPPGLGGGLAGFFYTGPDRDTLFHQFHRGNDQAPIVALTQLLEVMPQHPDAGAWTRAVELHLEYQKSLAALMEPWGMLPAYLYRDGDERFIPDSGALHGATRDGYREQVRAGLALGGGWYLRAFPVWFARRGNYGILLSQAKALSAAARFRGDSAAWDLAHRQAQWIVGRNPFARSTMYGEGYGFDQQYSVSSGDFVGSLPVGMQSRGATDVPYWPQQNTYVYREVWVHSASRWLWLMADLLGAAP